MCMCVGLQWKNHLLFNEKRKFMLVKEDEALQYKQYYKTQKSNNESSFNCYEIYKKKAFLNSIL